MLTMRKILCRALLCLCLVLALAPVPAAYAQDLDRIESYDVDVTPDTQDGSLRIQVTLEWTVLAEGPVSWVKIGVPNGSIREETALTDNIDRLSFDNSYMYVYFDRDYNDGETFRFSYSWVQEYMYALEGDTVSYDYTPGWFDEARVERDARHPNSSPSSKRCISCSVMVLLSPLKLYVNVMWSS